MIDSGSTLSRFAQVIPNNTDLRVVTNSLTTAQILAEANVSPVFVIGGEVRTETLAMVDASAVAAIAPIAEAKVQCHGAAPFRLCVRYRR